MVVREFVHPRLDAEVTAVGGHYVFAREQRIDVEGRRILYFVGYGVFDTTCCGAGGCGYALVAGEVVDDVERYSDDGRRVSRVVPIAEGERRETLRRWITETEYVSQVVFET